MSKFTCEDFRGSVVLVSFYKGHYFVQVDFSLSGMTDPPNIGMFVSLPETPSDVFYLSSLGIM